MTVLCESAIASKCNSMQLFSATTVWGCATHVHTVTSCERTIRTYSRTCDLPIIRDTPLRVNIDAEIPECIPRGSREHTREFDETSSSVTLFREIRASPRQARGMYVPKEYKIRNINMYNESEGQSIAACSETPKCRETGNSERKLTRRLADNL